MFLGLLLANAGSMAATFVDDFSLGLRPECWTVLQSTPGFYSVNATDGTVRLAKGSATTPGGVQYVFVRLNLAEFGGPVTGDFSTQVDFTNAVIAGPGLNQVELHTYFEDGSIFYAVYDQSSGLNAHVWDGYGVRGTLAVSGSSGTFVIARAGATLSAYYNGTLLFSSEKTSPLSNVDFVLQNNQGSDDPISVTFDNFSLTAASVVPKLSISSLAGQKIALSWITGFSGFVLEQSPSMAAASWTETSHPPAEVSGGRYVVTLDAPDAPRFYRLRNTP